MRTSFIQTSICLGLSVATGCSKAVINLDGEVNGKSVNGSAHWGGPHIIFTDSDMGCQSVDWVQLSYGASDQVDLLTDDSFAALQITYKGTDVVEGTAQIPPTNAWFIESDDGTGTITDGATGNIDLEFDGDWLIGEIDVSFGEAGQISGDFEIEKCVNLKSIED